MWGRWWEEYLTLRKRVSSASSVLHKDRSAEPGPVLREGGGANRALALKSAINPKDLRGFGERG